MGIIIDARAEPTGSSRHADICVIGGGPAGTTVPLELARAGTATVLLVESGGWWPEPETEPLNTAELVGQPITGAFNAPLSSESLRVRAFGGGTRHWGGYCHPLEPIDLEHRAYLSATGWPISHAEIAAWYPAAHDRLLLGPYNYDPTSLAGMVGAQPPLDLGPNLTTAIVQRRATRLGWEDLPEIGAGPGISLLYHANVTHLQLHPSGGHVVSATARTTTGVQIELTADRFVIATGGWETPRLLLSSNDVRPAGIGNDHDLVGRYYADHLGISLALGLLVPAPEDLSLYDVTGLPLTTATPSGTPTQVHAFGAIGLSETARRDHDLPSVHVELLLEPAGALPEQATGASVSGLQDLLRASPGGAARTIATGRVFVEPVPRHDSRVRLSPSTDLFGMPLAQVDWRVDPLDLAHLTSSMEIVAAGISAAGVGRLQAPFGAVGVIDNPVSGRVAGNVRVVPQTNTPANVLFETTYHHLGTTRMADSATDGVTDPDGKVHGVDNLFVAGSSVFPTAAGYYPTLTIVALAFRLAHHLLEEST